MGRKRSFVGLVAAALAVATIALAAPAGAAVSNACASPGGISQFPNAPAGQSTLQVSCTFTTATAIANPFFKVEDSPQAAWHFGAGRQVTGNTTSGSTTITLTAGSVFATDVNHGISGFSASVSLNGGTGTTAVANSALPAGAYIVSVTNATTAVLNVAATATGTAKKWTIENSDSRTFKDAVTTSGSGTVTSATANFTAADVGRTITGTNMKHGAKITARTERDASNGGAGRDGDRYSPTTVDRSGRYPDERPLRARCAHDGRIDDTHIGLGCFRRGV